MKENGMCMRSVIKDHYILLLIIGIIFPFIPYDYTKKNGEQNYT